MYGYSVTAVRVVRTGAEDAPLQVDNLDGRGLDLTSEWRRFFSQPQEDHQIRIRRYWQSSACGRPINREGVPWIHLEVEYGPNGIPGRVLDTVSGRQTAPVRVQDATVHNYRHVLTRPTGGTAALLAGEQIGRSRAQAGPLDAFRKHFEASQHGLRLSFESVTDGEYWQQFLANAALLSATLTRQASAPSYLSLSSSGQQQLAKYETTVKPAGRGARWPASVLPPLFRGAVQPGEVFGVGFEPDQTSLVLLANGQRRTIVLNADEPPSFTYPVGNLDRSDQPGGQEFFLAAEGTLDRLLPSFE